MSNNTLSEVLNLDQDIRELYQDYGSACLYVLKKDKEGSPIDDLYQVYREENFFTPYKVLGVVATKSSNETPTEIGKANFPVTYSVKVLRSSLSEQGVNNLTVEDKLMYNEMELEIISVKPHPMLGDYFVQYDVVAQGKRLPLIEDYNV